MKRFIALVLSAIVLCGSFEVKGLSLSASAAVIMDGISGKVLYEVGGNKRLSMASTTKIMTALLLCEQGDLSKSISVTEEMIRVEGTSMGLTVGQKVTYRDLLYGMLLSSGNDAANAVAVAVGGSAENFVAMMNGKAQELGLINTHFDTPSGLDGDTHYTTAYELALLTKEALKNEDFSAAVSSSEITLNYGGMKHTLINHNRLLKEYDGAVGVKTGFTKKSGRCLVSAARKGDGLIIAVTLNDRNDWNDHKAMLDYGFSQLNDSPQRFPSKTYTVKVFGGEIGCVTAITQEVAFCTAKGESVTAEEYVLPFVYAPVKEGDFLGYVEYYCGENLVAKQTLSAGNKVEAAPEAGLVEKFIISFKKLLNLI